MNLEKEFVPYPESLDMKELGFDEKCFGYYVGGELRGVNLGLEELGGVEPYYKRFGFHTICNSDINNMEKSVVTAPTFSQAFRWFREKHDLQCWVEPTGSDRYSCRYDGNDKTGYRWVGYLRNIDNEILFYPTYEEAELACLKKLISIVKNK